MWHQTNYVLMLKVVFRSNCCKGGTGLWTAGLEEDVKDSFRKDGLFVIEVVAGYGFCMDVESFNSVVNTIERFHIHAV